MMNSGQTIWYFIKYGLIEGAAAGLLVGTLMYPILGTVVCLMWGGSAGMILGLVLGALIAFYNWQFLHYDTDPQTYRRRLVGVVGGLAAVGVGLSVLAPFMVSFLQIMSVAHETYQDSSEINFVEIANSILLLGIILALPVMLAGFLAAGLTASRYGEHYFAMLTKRKNEDIAESVHWSARPKMGGFELWGQLLLKRGRSLIMAFSVGIMIFLPIVRLDLYYDFHVAPSLFLLLAETGLFVVGFLLYSGILILVIAGLNSFVLRALNRIYFDEYVPHLAMAHYRWRVMGIAFVITLIGSLVVTVGIGAIPSAIVAALAARDYAAWRYGEADHKEKRKLAEMSA